MVLQATFLLDYRHSGEENTLSREREGEQGRSHEVQTLGKTSHKVSEGFKNACG